MTRLVAFAILSILLVLEVAAQDDYKIESRYKPFSILIINPDKAVTDESLKVYSDSIELEFRNMYSELLNDIDSQENLTEEMKKDKVNLIEDFARLSELNAFDVKYTQIISIGSFFSLMEYFQQYPWEKEQNLVCRIVDWRKVYTQDLNQLATDIGVDYVVFFKDIYIEKYNDEFKMAITTVLFSKIEGKIIMEKKSVEQSDKWICHFRNQNLLMCLLTRCTESLTGELFDILKEKQKK